MAKLSPEEAQRRGRLGGLAAAGAGIRALNASLTASERSKRARRAVLARWSKLTPAGRTQATSPAVDGHRRAAAKRARKKLRKDCAK